MIQALLEQLPDLRVLVTSRQVLNLPGEREYPVLPLPTPGQPSLEDHAPPAGGAGVEADDSLTPAGLSLYESVRLFIDRAQAV